MYIHTYIYAQAHTHAYTPMHTRVCILRTHIYAYSVGMLGGGQAQRMPGQQSEGLMGRGTVTIIK